MKLGWGPSFVICSKDHHLRITFPIRSQAQTPTPANAKWKSGFPHEQSRISLFWHWNRSIQKGSWRIRWSCRKLSILTSKTLRKILTIWCRFKVWKQMFWGSAAVNRKLKTRKCYIGKKLANLKRKFNKLLWLIPKLLRINAGINENLMKVTLSS